MMNESPTRRLAETWWRCWDRLRRDAGSQIVEFAITVPLLAIFSVGIFDFGGAFNAKQKIAAAAQEGATTAAGQPTFDLDQANPFSVQAAESAVFNSLANQKVLPQANIGGCVANVVPVQTNLSWTYTIPSCGVTGDSLIITVDRGFTFWTQANAEKVIASHVTVTFPFHWQFNSVISLLVTNPTYAATTQIVADAVAPNQL